MRQAVLQFWYRKSRFAKLLAPLSWLFQGGVKLRYSFYRYVARQQAFSVPIIVVGNITVGGTGKTPLVSWLAEVLQQQGLTPGIVMRGYGAALQGKALKVVTPKCSARTVGDEALLLRQKTGCPLVIGKNRPAAVEHLLATFPEIDIIISDDGLQHYALARDIEIAVIDGQRRLGNGYCLPIGPLRESEQRLQTVDFVVANGNAFPGEWVMGTQLSNTCYAVNDANLQLSLEHLQGKTVHAVAGIGNPERFFAALRAKGVQVIAHPFPDHYDFQKTDLLFNDQLPIVMTEKDAVKCRHFALSDIWCIPLEVKLQDEFREKLLRKIYSGQKIAGHFSLPALQATTDLQER